MIAASPRLEEALEAIRSGLFSADDRSRYEGLVDGLVHDDRFMLCADFEAYWHAQCRVEEVWASPIAGGARRCSTWRGSAGSAPTGRSANTPGISGSYEGPYQKPAG